MQFGLLKVSGEHTKKFLQGQLTCDVNQVAENQTKLGAHCNQQGRVLFNFLISYQTPNYFLRLPADMLAIAKTRLQKFAIFSQVSVDILPELDDTTLLENSIDHGLVTIHPATSGLFTPHELNYPKLAAVSFNKGCYTGQ